MSEAPVALITGGSTGIGAATVRLLLKEGFRVCATARHADALDRLAAAAGRPAELITAAGDASSSADVQDAVEAAVSRFGRLDVAVASAGFATSGSIAEGDPDEWREMVLTNVLGPALLIRAALPALRATRGRIVLIGSVAGTMHLRGNFYSATKWALTGLAENTRLLAAEDGIGVTLINPGRVETPFWDAHGGVPAGAVLTSDEVAQAVVWAATQSANVDVNTVTVRPTGATF